MVSARVQAEGILGNWEAVYIEHAVRLTRLATVLTGPEDAQDLVSEAVRRAIGQPGWDGIRDKDAYLVTAVVNQVRQLHRERSRRSAREQRAARLRPVGPAYEPPSPDLDVRAALDRLSPQQRAVVYLHYWEDLSLPEVARLLDVSEGTVRRQLARAKAKLKELLDG